MFLIVDFLTMLVFCLSMLLELVLILGAVFITVLWVKVIFISLAVIVTTGIVFWAWDEYLTYYLSYWFKSASNQKHK